MTRSLKDRVRDRANRFWYLWRRNNWLVDPRGVVAHFREVEVDRPVFLVGNQGDGLTLVSRMLRRHPQIVSLSGNHHYWAGADEMHRAMLGRLPPSLVSGGKWLGNGPRHEVLTPPLSWSYAADDLLGHYRRTAADYDERAAKKLHAVIRESLYRHGRPSGGRFTDKSQTVTVRMSYVNALLRDVQPHFVLITRDPYASCLRNAIGGAHDLRRVADTLDLSARFEICVQHWINSMRCVEEDKDEVAAFTWMRFEDVLSKPDESMRTLCEFLGLPYAGDMVPAAGQSVPFGSRFPERWYPLKREVNDRYLADLPDEFETKLVERAGELAAGFGYQPPSRRRGAEQA